MTTWDTARQPTCRLIVSPPNSTECRGREPARALALRVRSNRRTQLFVRLVLSAPGGNDAHGASARFAVEWEDWQVLYFTRGHFYLPVEAPWPAFTEAVLEALDFGRPDTVLDFEPPQWVEAIPPLPINTNERLLEWFQYPPLWNPEEWTRVTDGSGANAEDGLRPNWFYATLEYVEGADLRHSVAVRKQFDADLRGVQALRLFTAIDPRCLLSVSAVIDGRDCRLLEGLEGRGRGVELRMTVQGRLLESICLQLDENPSAAGQSRGQTIGAQLRWLMLERAGADPASGNEVTGMPAVPDAGFRAGARLPIGLLFGQPDVAGLKERFSSGVPRRLFDELRAHAETTWDDAPERWVGSYMPVDWGDQGVERASAAVEQAGRWVTNMVYGGFVYALTGDERLGRAARRALLATVRTGHWVAGFPTRFAVGQPGYRAPFVEAHITEAVALCYDWIHDGLSPEERIEVVDAIFEKGVLWLDAYLRREGEGYLLKSNQGAVYFYGLLCGCLATGSRYPEAGVILERHIPWFRRMLRAYYHSDGSTDEGLNYWEYTSCYATGALALLALHFGLKPTEVAPPEFADTVKYVLHMRLPMTDGLAFLNIADGQSRAVKHAGSSLLFFARYYDSAPALWLWNRFFAGAHKADDPYFGSATIQYSTVALLSALWHIEGDPPDPVLPAVKRFKSPSSDRVVFHAGSAGAEWLVYFEAGPQTFMHTHMDKGSFLLNAYGEALVTEGGMIAYSDPSHIHLVHTFYHNVVTVRDRDQSYRDAEQAALITELHDEPEWSALTADLSASYRELRRYVRRLLFVRGSYLVVMDDLQSDEPGLAWRLHSVGEFAPAPEEGGAAARLSVSANGAGMEVVLAANVPITCQPGTVRSAAGLICHSLTVRPPSDARSFRIVGVLAPWSGGGSPASRTAVKCRSAPGVVELALRGEWGEDILACRLDGPEPDHPLSLHRNGRLLL
jgi:hypothetical protein